MKKEEFKILVAEDDEMVRDVVLKILTDEAYSVILANDGQEAINLLRLEDVKMVITDLRMPEADGMDVLRTALRINPQIIVVLVTAYGTLDIVLEAMKEGAYDYLVKPFVMAQLLIIVRNAYKLSSLIEENKKLMKQLKATYRSLENAKTMVNSNGDTAKLEAIEQIDRLQESNMSDSGEAEMRGNVTGKNNSESIKKYSSLIDNLRIEKQ